MTVDVYVRSGDAAFLDDIDEIIEETMVQMFILQPRDLDELETAKEQADEHNPIFYCAPLTLRDEIDGNCVAFFVDDADALSAAPEKPLFVEESQLDGTMVDVLAEGAFRGIILNATYAHEGLKDFYLGIGPGTVGKFDPDTLAKLPMERLVMQSGYPEYGFEA
ncbi:MAG: hypothetical protein WCB49_08865, partial [Gammaproteobacteria bacterium]